MERAFIVRGRLTGPRTVELAEPITGVDVEVEVMVREVRRAVPPPEDTESPVAMLRRDVIDAALAGKPPQVEVVYDGSDPGATSAGMIFSRRKTAPPTPTAGDEEDEDTNPELPAPNTK